MWSDVAAWGETRQLGRGRFIRRTVLRWGLVFSLSQCAGYACWGETDPVKYALTTLWLVVGYMYGRWYWRSAETDYALWQAGHGAAAGASGG